MVEWLRLEQKILTRSQPLPEFFTNYFVASARDLTMDARGRITIPEALRQHAAIGKTAAMLGLIDHVRIWDLGAWRRVFTEHARMFEATPDLSGLGLEAEQERSPRPSIPKRVEVVDASAEILAMLRLEPEIIYRISPDAFEALVCERLDARGFSVTRIGSVSRADGGIDILACSRVPSPYVLAVQVKHRRLATRRVGASAVRDFTGVVATGPFSAGLMVTNTTYTADACEFAAKGARRLVALRDIEDVRRWIADDFLSVEELRGFPEVIEVRPGFVVPVPWAR
jgi:hypothetical protein